MKRLLIVFLKDKLSFLIGYSLCCFILILFYRLSTGITVEILYPLGLCFFILMAVLLMEWLSFYPYNKNISQLAEQPDLKLSARTQEQKRHYQALLGMQHHYRNDVHSMKMKDRDFRRFLAQWVHHMKTPVSVTDLILQNAHDKSNTIDTMISELKNENQRILEGLEQVLSIIRLDEFTHDYDPAATDLLEDIRQVVNLRKSQFIYHHIFPEIQCTYHKLNVLTDSKWNRVLLDQIISNAIKYTPMNQEGSKLILKVEIDTKEISLVVEDQGLGIPAYDLKFIFQPFFTGENGRKVKGSTGIGLYLCKEIADRLGHRLDVESQANRGTRVTISYQRTGDVTNL